MDAYSRLANFKSAQNIFSSVDTAAVSATASIYTILFRIGVFGLMISVMACGISFLYNSSDARKRQENKSWALRIALAAVCIFGFMSIFSFILQVLGV